MTTPSPRATLHQCLDGVTRPCLVLGPAQKADVRQHILDRQRPEEYLVVQTLYNDRLVVNKRRVQ